MTIPPMMVQNLTGDPNFPLPSRATNGSAAYDLHAAADVTLYLETPTRVPTGYAWAIPEGWVGVIKDRSSMAMMGVTTSAGVIDSDYRGEVSVILTANQTTRFRKGERIAQMLVVSTYPYVVTPVAELDETERGFNGFGSTGR